MCRSCSFLRTQKRHKAASWMKRSVATKTAHTVETEVAVLTARCKFLQQRQQATQNGECNNSIGLFHRCEIGTGELVGQGAFSEVWEVKEIILRHSSRFSEREQQVRETLSKNCLDAFGNCRYVIKHLKDGLASKRRIFHQAAADLVIESMFLSNLNHPNIVKVRGWAAGGAASFADDELCGYFVLMDKLDETLAQRMNKWQKERHRRNNKLYHYAEKVDYAHQIACALDFLHDQDIIFRDLKPDNVGFKGDTIQIFDFGLCRELPEATTDEEKVFEMSGVGTRRYMAPEIILGTGYNLKIDVYSWSMVFYEMMGLQKPFGLYNRELHRIMVCEGGQRPTLRPYWPEEVRHLLQQAWVQDPLERLSIKQVCTKLAPLVDLSERQMLLPSERSARIIFEMADLLVSKKKSVSDLTASIVFKKKSSSDLTATTETLVSLNL